MVGEGKRGLQFGYTIINKTNSRQNGLTNILSPIPTPASQQSHLVAPNPLSLSSNVGNSMTFFNGNNFPEPYHKREYLNRYHEEQARPSKLPNPPLDAYRPQDPPHQKQEVPSYRPQEPYLRPDQQYSARSQ